MEQNNFIIDQKRLSHMLASMQAICAKRTTLDATTAVLFQPLKNWALRVDYIYIPICYAIRLLPIF
jgi:hypothetical protein